MSNRRIISAVLAACALPTLAAAGPIDYQPTGDYIAFDGVDDVMLIPAVLQPNRAFTIEMGLRFDLPPDPDPIVIFTEGKRYTLQNENGGCTNQRRSAGVSLQALDRNGRTVIRAEIAKRGRGYKDHHSRAIEYTLPDDFGWHHVAMTFEPLAQPVNDDIFDTSGAGQLDLRGRLRLFIDGQFVGATTWGGSANVNGRTAYEGFWPTYNSAAIGASTIINGAYCDDTTPRVVDHAAISIDDLRIWNTTRTVTELIATAGLCMSRTEPADTAGLVISITGNADSPTITGMQGNPARVLMTTAQPATLGTHAELDTDDPALIPASTKSCTACMWLDLAEPFGEITSADLQAFLTAFVMCGGDLPPPPDPEPEPEPEPGPRPNTGPNPGPEPEPESGPGPRPTKSRPIGGNTVNVAGRPTSIGGPK